ncbi:hypothetical protein [Actinomadura sp. 7K534]|uniref:hypothetical protein n=1 Tax=Actinomadura sp. 7K534 TaxID=2530366 RepID=UPI001047CC91|nr:hypothetical protein [Actinomadura sp. 7K534]TDB96217.1 hypothetical protein E1266_10535 [Actinomadura sp. 7K534]
MSGNVLLLLGVAALAIYMGVHWERARRAVSDLRLSRQRITGLRQVVARERGHVAMIWAAAALALFLAIRYG